MRILLLEPYLSGSHAAWAEGYAAHSRHQVEILGLSGQFWKWRMHGGAVTLAKKYITGAFDPDLILATDMLDLTTFLALTRDRTACLPCAVYFHENQITYPWSPGDRDVLYQRDKHYGFINYVTALSADAVFFNSAYHRDVFLKELPRLLKHFPDHQGLSRVSEIAAKSRVLHLGLDLERLDAGSNSRSSIEDDHDPPLILWNHRWEYDKNPGEFFHALDILVQKGLDFRLVILGENFRRSPQEFQQARKSLGDRILHFGYVADQKEYAKWLQQADILPVTSWQDFFGISIVEAVYSGCYPLLPHRLTYPEIFPVGECEDYYYSDFDDLVKKLEFMIRNISEIRRMDLRFLVEKYNWSSRAPIYDNTFQKLLMRD